MNTKFKNEQEDDLLNLGKEQYLGYFTKVIPTSVMTVHIDEPIREPAYYRQIASGIDELSEGDELVFEIASPGGRMDGLEVLLSAMRRTDATTVAQINGDCHSAASILALNCDVVSVSPYGSMLVHFVSYGSAGASNHVLKQAEHIKKVSEQLFRDTYQFFLTEEEITKCVEDDFQLWLDSSQILERLKYRSEMYKKLYEEQDDIAEDGSCCGTCNNTCNDKMLEDILEDDEEDFSTVSNGYQQGVFNAVDSSVERIEERIEQLENVILPAVPYDLQEKDLPY